MFEPVMRLKNLITKETVGYLFQIDDFGNRVAVDSAVGTEFEDYIEYLEMEEADVVVWRNMFGLIDNAIYYSDEHNVLPHEKTDDGRHFIYGYLFDSMSLVPLLKGGKYADS